MTICNFTLKAIGATCLAVLIVGLSIRKSHAQPVSTPVLLSELISGEGYIESPKYHYAEFLLMEDPFFPSNIGTHEVQVDLVSLGSFEGIRFIPLSNAYTPSAASYRNIDFSFVASSRSPERNIAATRILIDGVASGSTGISASGGYFDGSEEPIAVGLGTAVHRLPVRDSETTSESERLRFLKPNVEVRVGISSAMGAPPGGLSVNSVQHLFLQDSELHGGDFDLDEDVDGQDFLLWQKNYGAAADGNSLDLTPTGDGNRDSVVDAADYTVWRDTFGLDIASLGQQRTSTAVPEPTSIYLVCLTIVIVVGTAIGLRRR